MKALKWHDSATLSSWYIKFLEDYQAGKLNPS